MKRTKPVQMRWDKEVLEHTDAAVKNSPRKTTRSRYFHEALVDKLENGGELTFTQAEEIRRRI